MIQFLVAVAAILVIASYPAGRTFLTWLVGTITVLVFLGLLMSKFLD